jgi:hypothetical protein
MHIGLQKMVSYWNIATLGSLYHRQEPVIYHHGLTSSLAVSYSLQRPRMCFFLFYNASPTPLQKHRILRPQITHGRFTSYARCIRTLTISGSTIPEFLLVARSFAGGAALLPYLKTLVVEGVWLAESVAASILAAVLSTSVQQIDIQLSSQDDLNFRDLHEMMDAILHYAPNLRAFNILGPNAFELQHNAEINQTFSIFLPRMVSLQVLKLGPEYARTDLLLKIAQSLPQLRVIDFHNTPGTNTPGFRISAERREQTEGKNANFPQLGALMLQVAESECDLEEMISRAFGRDHQLRCFSIILGDSLHSYFPLDWMKCAYRYCNTFAQSFPGVEVFHFDSRCSGLKTLGFKEITLFSRCSHLTDLSITGGQLATSEELVRLLKAWPRLVKFQLYGDGMKQTYYQYRLQHGSAENDIGELSEYELKCLGLECLPTIQYHLPALKVLGLTLAASPTASLKRALHPFKNLERMVLHAPFWNFKLPGFFPQQAAGFIGSFLRSSTTFHVIEDWSLQHHLEDLAEEEDFAEEEDSGAFDEMEGIPLWMKYAESHIKLCQDFPAMVSAPVGVR